MQAIRAGSEQAAAVVLQGRGARASERPARGRQRLLGVLQALGAGALAAVLLYFDFRVAGIVVSVVATVILFAALVSPDGLYAAIQRGFATLGRLTGVAVTWALMVPLFYLFFLPFGTLLRRGRRDRMQRRFERDAPSYWEPCDERLGGSASHARQY